MTSFGRKGPGNCTKTYSILMAVQGGFSHLFEKSKAERVYCHSSQL